jgi:hypothetical protein
MAFSGLFCDPPRRIARNIVIGRLINSVSGLLYTGELKVK